MLDTVKTRLKSAKENLNINNKDWKTIKLKKSVRCKNTCDMMGNGPVN